MLLSRIKPALTLCFMLLVGVPLASAQTLGTPEMLADEVVIPAYTGPTTWTQVTFSNAFSTQPVVLTLVDETNDDPASVRVRNVTTTGFEIAHFEPENNDGLTPAITVPWIAAQQGDWILPDGTHMAVGLIKLDNKVGTGPDLWLTHSYPSSFVDAPAVVAKIQTDNSEDTQPGAGASCQWMQEGVQSVGPTGFQYALDIAESLFGNCPIETEVMGYLAIEQNAFGTIQLLDGTTRMYEGRLTPDNILGHDNGGCQTTTFLNPYVNPPLVVGSRNRYDGNNGGWLRACNGITNTSIDLLIDEDQGQDPERSHTTENAGLFILGKPTTPSVEIDKFVKGVYRGGVLIGGGSTVSVAPGDIIYYVIDVQHSAPATIYDVYEPAELQFLPTSAVDTSSTPSAGPYGYDANGDLDLESVLEFTATGTGPSTSFAVYMLVL